MGIIFLLASVMDNVASIWSFIDSVVYANEFTVVSTFHGAGAGAPKNIFSGYRIHYSVFVLKPLNAECICGAITTCQCCALLYYSFL